MANLDWFRQTFDRISVSDARSDLLSEMKVALSGLNSVDQRTVARTLNVSAIFDCLNTSDKHQLELACDVLGKLLSALEPSAVLAQYGSQIQRSLIHPEACVKELVLREVERAVGNQVDMVERLSREEETLICVINCLCDENSSLARHAVNLLKRLGVCPVGLLALFSPTTLNALKLAASKNDIIRFRVYEVVVDISVQSEQGLSASQNCGMLDNLFNELRGTDVLAQVNVLEMLTSLALTQHGLTLLDQNGILDFLAAKLLGAHEDPLGSLLVPGLIKFFGNVAQSRPDDIIKRFPTVIGLVFDTLESPDYTVVGIGMETVGYIGTTLQGKYMLQSLGDKVPETIRRIFQKIPTLPMEVRIRLINSIAHLLDLKVQDQNNQSLSMTKCWFESISDNPMDTIMSMCRQPFPEMRLAAFQVMQVLASNPWGQEQIARASALVEYLLDRSTETIKSCKDAKFDVVQMLVDSPSAASVFTPQVMDRLQEFVREGEFYQRGETEVAIEGAL